MIKMVTMPQLRVYVNKINGSLMLDNNPIIEKKMAGTHIQWINLLVSF